MAHGKVHCNIITLDPLAHIHFIKINGLLLMQYPQTDPYIVDMSTNCISFTTVQSTAHYSHDLYDVQNGLPDNFQRLQQLVRSLDSLPSAYLCVYHPIFS